MQPEWREMSRESKRFCLMLKIEARRMCVSKTKKGSPATHKLN